jgi:hypothetical protein
MPISFVFLNEHDCALLSPLSYRFQRGRVHTHQQAALLWKRVVPLKRTLFRLIVAAILIIAFLIYRSRPRTHLNVTPDAQREIERTKRR